MKREAVLGVLTGVNLVLLLGIGVTQVLSAIAQTTPGPLRGNGLEIVDSAGL